MKDRLQKAEEAKEVNTCVDCNGKGEVYCCNGHMCPGNGYKLCKKCEGTGKR